jgi:hypothetical protein
MGRVSTRSAKGEKPQKTQDAADVGHKRPARRATAATRNRKPSSHMLGGKLIKVGSAMNEKKPTYRVEIKNSGTPPSEAYGWKIYRNRDVLPILQSEQFFSSRITGLADANRSRLQLINADTLKWPPQSN